MSLSNGIFGLSKRERCSILYSKQTESIYVNVALIVQIIVLY